MAVSAALLVQAGVQLFSAILYFWVARIILQRELQGETKRANVLFGTWWIGLGLVFLLSPLYRIVPAFAGIQSLAFAVVLLNLLIILIVVALWGLVYYLTYLYTGSARAFWPVAAFYVLLAFAFLYLIAWMGPNGFDESGALTFERRAAGAPAIGIGLLFSLPVLIAAIAYGGLFFRVTGRELRYRIALISGGFILQFGWSSVSSLLQLATRYPDSPLLPLVSNVFGILAAFAVLLAFRPPIAIRRRLGGSGAGVE